MRSGVTYLFALAGIALSFGCSEDRGETVAWRGHPDIVLCPDQPSIFSHALGLHCTDGSGGFWTINGIYREDEDTVYLACANPDRLLTIPQALFLAHELQHVADRKYGGFLWRVLQDESSPNGHTANGGGVDFDSHHHPMPSQTLKIKDAP